MAQETHQFICIIEDTINEDAVISLTWCHVRTPKQAEAYFKKHKDVKKYLGNMRYKITFRQNAIMIQDNYQWHQQWKAQK